MADHQPAMRAQHREMVGDVLGVGRPDADIDDGYPALPVRARQVIGRHLEALPGGCGHQCRRIRGIAANFDPTRRDQAVIGRCRVGELVQPPAHELIDIALVVGQQNPRLDVAPGCAGVVHQSAQGKIDAHGIEQAKRHRLASGNHP